MQPPKEIRVSEQYLSVPGDNARCGHGTAAALAGGGIVLQSPLGRSAAFPGTSPSLV